MITRYFAFLRAINVGGHTVKMEILRSLFESLGFTRLETFIASGNVIFEVDEQDTQLLEKQIERHLRDALGYEVSTFLRTTSQLQAIATYQAFDPAEMDASARLYVSFVSAIPGEDARQKLWTYRTANNDFAIHDREIYWLSRTRISESTFSGAILEKALKMPATMRNITTIKKLAAKWPV